MAKLNRENVIAEALDLLDEVGLDAVSTRRLALRLGVEQPSLYWHFRTKANLLSALAESAMTPHANAPLPSPTDDWREWFAGNFRSFRSTLLLRRDGARLHAGLVPGADLPRILAKMDFLAASGVPAIDAQMAMLAASRFTVGSVLEEQADPGQGDDHRDNNTPADAKAVDAAGHIDVPRIDHASAFEAGLGFIVDGVASRKGVS